MCLFSKQLIMKYSISFWFFGRPLILIVMTSQWESRRRKHSKIYITLHYFQCPYLSSYSSFHKNEAEQNLVSCHSGMIKTVYACLYLLLIPPHKPSDDSFLPYSPCSPEVIVFCIYMLAVWFYISLAVSKLFPGLKTIILFKGSGCFDVLRNAGKKNQRNIVLGCQNLFCSLKLKHTVLP